MTKGYNKSPKPFSPLKVKKKRKKSGVGSGAGTASDGVEDPAITAARRKELAASKRKRGRIGTALTGALGDPAEPSVKRRKLGG